MTNAIGKVFQNFFPQTTKYAGNVADSLKHVLNTSKDLYGSLDDTMAQVAYKSNGIIGICEDIQKTIPALTAQANELKNGIKNLERIVTRKNIPQTIINNLPITNQVYKNIIVPINSQTTNKGNQTNINNLSTENICDIVEDKQSIEKEQAMPVDIMQNNISSTIKTPFIYSFKPEEHVDKNDFTKQKQIENKYSKDQLVQIINMKNKYLNQKYNSLDEKISQRLGYFVNSLKNILGDLIYSRANTAVLPSSFIDIPKINYDKRYIPESVKNEIIGIYLDNKMTLKDASEYIAEKYGIHVSGRTLSKNVRSELKDRLHKKFKKRCDAQKYYMKHLNNKGRHP